LSLRSGKTGFKAGFLISNFVPLHTGSFWIHEWVKAMEQSGGGGVEGSNGEGGGGGGGGGSGEEGTKAYSGISSSTYDNRLAALDGVLTKAAHTLGSSYLVPLTSGWGAVTSQSPWTHSPKP
jgi:hypothetical protein